MKKLILAGVLASIALVSLPSASFAYGGGSPTVDGTVGPSQTVSVDWPTEYFGDGELVTATVTCTSGTPTILNDEATPAIFRALTATGSYQATPSGAFSLEILLPAGDFGTCSCEVLGLSTGTTGSADLAYVPGEAVAYTGLSVGLYAWTAAGVIVLGGALVTVVVARRKARAKAST
jgi:hypothetical protein